MDRFFLLVASCLQYLFSWIPFYPGLKVYEETLDLADYMEPKEENVIKPGDRVKVLRNVCCARKPGGEKNYYLQPGDIITVKQIGGSKENPQIIYDVVIGDFINTNFIWLVDVEKVMEEEIPTLDLADYMEPNEESIKVSDRVRVIRNVVGAHKPYSGGNRLEAGDFITVKSIDNEKNHILYDLVDYQYHNFIPLEDVEKVVEEDTTWLDKVEIPPAPVEEPEKKPDFKAGDKVRIIAQKPANARWWVSPAMDGTCGKVGEVAVSREYADASMNATIYHHVNLEDGRWFEYRAEWLEKLVPVAELIKQAEEKKTELDRQSHLTWFKEKVQFKTICLDNKVTTEVSVDGETIKIINFDLPKPEDNKEDEIKTGDKVICLYADGWERWLTKGKEYVITNYSRGDVYLTCDNGEGRWIWKGAFKKVAQPEFKKGDKVRVVAKIPESASILPGWIGDMDKTCDKIGEVICEMQPAGIWVKCYVVAFSDYHPNCYRPEWLEKVEEETPKPVVVSKEVASSDFKKCNEEDEIKTGDKVICVDASGGSENSHSLTAGKEYHVQLADGGQTIIVCGDDEVNHWYWRRRFKKVASPIRVGDTVICVEASPFISKGKKYDVQETMYDSSPMRRGILIRGDDGIRRWYEEACFQKAS